MVFERTGNPGKQGNEDRKLDVYERVVRSGSGPEIETEMPADARSQYHDGGQGAQIGPNDAAEEFSPIGEPDSAGLEGMEHLHEQEEGNGLAGPENGARFGFRHGVEPDDAQDADAFHEVEKGIVSFTAEMDGHFHFIACPIVPGGPGSVRAVTTGLGRDMTGTYRSRGRDGARPSRFVIVVTAWRWDWWGSGGMSGRRGVGGFG